MKNNNTFIYFLVNRRTIIIILATIPTIQPSILIYLIAGLLLGWGGSTTNGALSKGICWTGGACCISGWFIGSAGDWVIGWTATISGFEMGGATWSDKGGYIFGAWGV